MFKTENNNNKKEGKLFSFFSPSRSRNAGLTKQQAQFDGKYNFVNFFKFLKNHFGDLTILNLIFILTNFSLILVLFSVSGNTNVSVDTPASPFYQHIYSAMRYGTGVQTSVLNSVFGSVTQLSVPTVFTKILYYSAFTLLVTFGLSNIGMAYVTRAMVRREHTFVWHDFWYAVKRDWKQGLIIGVIDCVVIFLVSYALMFYYSNLSVGGFQLTVMFYLAVFFAFFYFVMRIYIYLMAITFTLKTFKLIKNAVIFSLLGIKRNICAVLGIGVVAFVGYYLILMFSTVAMILPFIFTIALMYFIGTYCAYPVIVKYMIEPYEKEHPKAEETVPEEERIFIDRG